MAEVKRLHKQLQGEQILSLTLGEVTVFQQAVEKAENALAALQEYAEPTEEIESIESMETTYMIQDYQLNQRECLGISML